MCVPYTLKNLNHFPMKTPFNTKVLLCQKDCFHYFYFLYKNIFILHVLCKYNDIKHIPKNITELYNSTYLTTQDNLLYT